jgi:hypothetical protein
MPLIFFKGDLLAVFLYMGYIILLPMGPLNLHRDGARWTLGLADHEAVQPSA